MVTKDGDHERREEKWRPQTRLVRGGTRRSGFGETSEALFLASGYVYDRPETAEARFKGEAEGYIYSRYGNPTVAMFERRLALLEGADDCRGTASGMAAVFASLMALVRAGDYVVSSRALFGSCQFIIAGLLPRFGVETTFVDGPDLDQWRAALRPGTKAVFLETPSNPTLEIIDLKAVCDLAHAVGARVVVDNVFATPMLQHPFEFGADIVVYSATKHIDGQGRCLGGAVLGSKEFINDELTPFYRHTGPSLSPFNAWVLLKSLETLELRVAAHCKNAHVIASFLEGRAGVTRVLYPGLPSHPQYALASTQMKDAGTLVTFELDGGKDRAFRFLKSLELIEISNNLGDTKSLVTHPATTTHQRLTPQERADMGISDSMVRVSVGLEDVEDIKEDLARALASS